MGLHNHVHSDTSFTSQYEKSSVKKEQACKIKCLPNALVILTQHPIPIYILSSVEA